MSDIHVSQNGSSQDELPNGVTAVDDYDFVAPTREFNYAQELILQDITSRAAALETLKKHYRELSTDITLMINGQGNPKSRPVK